MDWTEADLAQNREIVAIKKQIADIHVAFKRDNLVRRVEALKVALADIRAAFKRDNLVHRVESLEGKAPASNDRRLTLPSTVRDK